MIFCVSYVRLRFVAFLMRNSVRKVAFPPYCGPSCIRCNLAAEAFSGKRLQRVGAAGCSQPFIGPLAFFDLLLENLSAWSLNPSTPILPKTFRPAPRGYKPTVMAIPLFVSCFSRPIPTFSLISTNPFWDLC